MWGLALLLLASRQAWSNEQVKTIDNAREVLISSFPGYIIDEKGEYTFEQIQRMSFHAHEKETPSFGWSDNVIWLKSSFVKKDALPYVAEIGYPLLDDVTLWIFHNGQLRASYTAGDSVKNSKEILDPVDPAFDLMTESGSYDIVMRIKSSSSIQAPLKLYAKDHFNEKEKEDFLTTGIYIGILGIMALYNFFVFASSRHRSYLYYTGFVITFLLLQLSLSGHTFQYLWPSMPFLSDFMICQGGIIATMFMVLFADDYLRLSRETGRGRRVVLALEVMLGTVFVLSFIFKYVIAVKLMAVAAAISVITVLALAVVLMARGQREAQFYVAAWSIFIASCVVYLMKQLGFLPLNPITVYSFKVGAVLEISLLSFALADRLNTLKKQLSVANAELRVFNENLEQKVEEKTRDIKSILENIPQGIFQVKITDGQLAVDDEYSKFIASIVPVDKLAGSHPIDNVFARTELSDNDLSLVRTVLETSIKEDVMQYELNAHVLPREMKINSRLIEVDWSPIVSASSVVDKVLVTLKDVTDMRKLQMQAIEQAQEFTKLGEVARHDSEKMYGFFGVCNDLYESSFEKFDTNPNNIALTFRNLHTIKGLARNFQLRALTDAVHEVEQDLKNLQFTQINREMIVTTKNQILKTHEIFKEYERINNDVLGRAQYGNKVLVDRDDLHQIHDAIHSATGKNDLQDVEMKILFLFETKFQQVIADEISMIESVCRGLNKPMPHVHFINDKFIIPANMKSLLRKVFVHLLRNSIDHGIESPEERLHKRKSETGNITIEISELNEGVKIVYYDDGRGLALEKIKQKGIEKGILPEGKEVGALEVANLIFEPGFSTASAVTEISGRGVGMDAVRNFLMENGSSIKISLARETIAEYVPFCFEMSIKYVELRKNRVA
jgi:signal transduction histidine kinase